MKLPILFLLFLTVTLSTAQETPSPSATPEVTATPEPAETTAPSAATDTDPALPTTDPKADAQEQEEDVSRFNFWHRIFSPVAGVALVAVVVVVVLVYWRRRRQNAFVEAVHDTQTFREEI